VERGDRTGRDKARKAKHSLDLRRKNRHRAPRGAQKGLNAIIKDRPYGSAAIIPEEGEAGFEGSALELKKEQNKTGGERLHHGERGLPSKKKRRKEVIRAPLESRTKKSSRDLGKEYVLSEKV